jgi:hypothetical protein
MFAQKFFWTILFAAAFLGSIALLFYLTIELNELEKSTDKLSEDVRKRYGQPDKDK